MTISIVLTQHLEELQRTLAEVDLISRPSSGRGMEFLVLRFRKIVIKMDRNENHSRPHFHIDYGRDYHTASYAVDNGKRLAGSLPAKYDRKITKWAVKNSEQLLLLWDQMRADENYEDVLVELKGSKI